MKKCTIILLDEVNCTLQGISKADMNILVQSFSFHTPTYFFDPKYKFTDWDGKIKFIYENGQTKIRLLDEILEALVILHYDFEIVDNRTPFNIPKFEVNSRIFSDQVDPDSGEPIILYDYQVEMINSLIREGGGIGIAGTGAGKSMMCAALSHLYNIHCNFKTLVIVPKDDLVLQTYEAYRNLGLDVGQYCGTVKDLEHPHIISTWQALQHNKKLIQRYQMVIIDECHGTRGNVLQTLLNDHGQNIPIRMGVTATLPKEMVDRMSIKAALGGVVFEIPAIDLIKLGVLATPTIHVKIFEEDVTAEYARYIEDFQVSSTEEKPLTYLKFKNSYFPDYTSEKKHLHQRTDRITHISNMLTSASGNTFCLVESVAFGRKLAKNTPNAVFLYGKDKKKIRKEIYEQFKHRNDMIVITTAQIAYAGLNIKRIFNLFFIDIGKSFIKVMQSVGRGLRKAKDKETVDIYDICSDFKYGKKHLNERKKIYKEAGYNFNIIKIKYDKDEEI